VNRTLSQTKKTDAMASKSEFEFYETGPRISQAYLSRPIIDLLNRFGATGVLDPGCGNGAFTGLLAAEGFSVQGCDASSSGLQIAQASFPGIPFFHHNLSNALPECHRNQYDAVVSLEVIEHLLLPRTLKCGSPPDECVCCLAP
jgi:2-polyprenyl-3-methyl-5-hydroxy-6-metoxy-1,4-benzoquinol methylase